MIRVSRGLAVLLAVAANIPASAGEPLAVPSSSPESFVLSDLLWLVGRWSGTIDGMAGEETWNAPLGESMTGTFRLVREGTPVFYELMAVEQEGSGPVLLLRHFNRGLVDARPDVLRFPLARLTASGGVHEAVFEGPDKDGTARLTYRRTGDELTVVLDKTQAGKTDSRTFLFTLQR